MTENNTSSVTSTEQAPVTPKRGFNLLMMLLNLFWWILLIGAILAVFIGVIYVARDVLGFKTIWGALLAFPVAGVLVVLYFMIEGGSGGSFWEAIGAALGIGLVLGVGASIVWAVGEYFQFVGLGVLYAGLVLLGAWAVDFTEKSEPTPKKSPEEIAEAKLE